MPHLRNSLLLLLALLAFSVRAPAQQPTSTTDDPRPADAALRKKAFDLLETLADQVGTLQSPENRARLGSNIAASLWKHDEKRARTLLASVESDINTGMRQVDEDARTKTQTQMVFLKLRMDTVERIAKLDAETALAFLKATEPDPDITRSYEIAEMTANLELRLANQIAAENPDLALKLGRKSLARGFSNDLLALLRLLNKKDKEKAASLYKEIVAKLIGVGLQQYSPGIYFARGLASSFKPPAVDEATFRELIELFIDTAFKNDCHKPNEDDPDYFCRELAYVLRDMEKVDPNRAAELKRWAREPSDPNYDPGVAAEMEDIAQNGTVDELLALADKHPNMKEYIYFRAITMAGNSGDIERARKLAIAHIQNPEVRQDVLAGLDRFNAQFSTSAENLAEAQAVLNRIPNVRDRIRFLLYFANQIRNDRKSALKLLNQASEMVDTLKPGRERTEAELDLAMMYCAFKSDRGFERMQALLPMLNDLVAAAVKLDGYDSHNVRDGEWNMSLSGSVGSLLTKLSQGAGSFAWCDFDRAVSMAGQFERPEIRMMAQLKLAQAILAGPPKQFARTPPSRIR